MLKNKTILFISTIFLLSSFAEANIQVFPTRINLSPLEKTATISLRLRSNKPETFRISTMFYEMAKDGSVRQRPDLAKSQESASKYLSYSPKRVELQPNVEQVVRIRVRNITPLKEEVRTHLYFRPTDKVSKEPLKRNLSGKSAFELKAQVAVAIPVIIMPKITKKDYELSKFKLFAEEGSLKFKTVLTKTSKGFLYGDFKVYRHNGKKKELVGQAKGVSSYINERIVSYPIASLEDQKLTKAKYTLEFNEYSHGKPEKGHLKTLSLDYQ